MITKRKGPPRGRGGGRKPGPTGKAGITVTLRLTVEARAILATHERPGRWLSALIESAPARPEGRIAFEAFAKHHEDWRKAHGLGFYAHMDALRDEEWAAGKLHACGVLVAAERAVDKARDEVMAAVAALAGRKG